MPDVPGKCLWKGRTTGPEIEAPLLQVPIALAVRTALVTHGNHILQRFQWVSLHSIYHLRTYGCKSSIGYPYVWDGVAKWRVWNDAGPGAWSIPFILIHICMFWTYSYWCELFTYMICIYCPFGFTCISFYYLSVARQVCIDKHTYNYIHDTKYILYICACKYIHIIIYHKIIYNRF